MNRFLLIAALTLECRPAPRPRLAAMSPPYRVHTSITFELPDSGGLLANGEPVDTSKVEGLLREVFAARQPEQRAVFVIDNPRRAWTEIESIRSIARRAGGEAFDAELSGRLPLQGFRVIKVDSVR